MKKKKQKKKELLMETLRMELYLLTEVRLTKSGCLHRVSRVYSLWEWRLFQEQWRGLSSLLEDLDEKREAGELKGGVVVPFCVFALIAKFIIIWFCFVFTNTT
ncbi:PREDICTED: uncharacterized protein LOC104778160 [Camelina sativa]|uniref:Uncharacterized protein LOC104778160 n=1 Tax=Camelina sativa TaxID=90675 RepID=A0ABM0YH83_CAMSA|nr:PREDICTED: uncharacterized protein LOC104778160 [Camelina sativa]